MSYFLKIWSNKNLSNFDVYIIKSIWFKKFDQIKGTVMQIT